MDIPEQNITPPIAPVIQQQNKLNNKRYLIFIIIMILTLVLIGVYLVSSSQNRIAKTIPQPTVVPTIATITQIPDWKTFNKLEGASFQYPPEWTVDPELLTKTNTRVDMVDTAYGDKNCKGDCQSFHITWLVFDTPQNSTLPEMIKKDYADSNLSGQPPLKVEDITMSNGLQFKKATGIFNGLEYFYIEHNHKTYVTFAFAGANGTSDDPSDPKVQARLSVFHQMLSTLQFTN